MPQQLSESFTNHLSPYVRDINASAASLKKFSLNFWVTIALQAFNWLINISSAGNVDDHIYWHKQ